MKKQSLLLTIISLFALLLQGCGNSTDTKNEKVYPTAIGTGLSITTDEKNALMTPSVHALEEASNKIAHILKIHIEELNQKESVIFSRENFYCDISGFRTLENGEVLDINYDACKTKKRIQNGEIEITYGQTDSEGKYPQALKLIVKEAYTFNDTTLQKELIVESTILYAEDKSVKELSLNLTGMVNFDYQNLAYDEFKQKVKFP